MRRSTTGRGFAAARGIAVSCLAVAALLLFGAAPAAAQKLEVTNKSKLKLGSMQLSDSVTLSDKRYSLGFSNTYRSGRDLSNVISGRIDPTKSTKVSVHTSLNGGGTDWEAKVNQKYRSFTFDIGAGSDGLFHTGVAYGARKGKGFGFSASWVGDDRRSGASLQLWHYVESLDLTATVGHDRRGFGWSASTGEGLAKVIKGVLRYETTGGVDGNGASQQVVYGRNMRDGSDAYSGFDRIDFVPDEDVFGDDGINIRSPLYQDDDPLAWLVEGYGARFGEVELDKKRVLEAEMVSYLTDSVWVGGDFVMKDGRPETIESRFGVTADSLKLAASFGYGPQSQRFSGAVQLRWTPMK
ncbi:MAG TPA: hypothetical protein VGD06_08830 [Acidobacteriota bacterium]